METQTMALSDTWLSTQDNTMTTGGLSFNNYGSSGWYYTEPYPWHWTRWKELTIELTMTEVEHLRDVVKKDKKLRKTLEKFTPHIKVRVDFSG